MSHTSSVRIYDLDLSNSIHVQTIESLYDLFVRLLDNTETISLIFDTKTRFRVSVTNENAIHAILNEMDISATETTIPSKAELREIRVKDDSIEMSNNSTKTQLVFYQVRQTTKESIRALLSVVSPQTKLIITGKSSALNSQTFSFTARFVLLTPKDRSQSTVKHFIQNLYQFAGGSGVQVRRLANGELRKHFMNELMWLPKPSNENSIELDDLLSIVKSHSTRYYTGRSSLASEHLSLQPKEHPLPLQTMDSTNTATTSIAETTKQQTIEEPPKMYLLSSE